MEFDLDGNGSFEITRNFYRLFGDVNGDRVVDNLDFSAILYAFGSVGDGLDEDLNGDGVVNAQDRLSPSALAVARRSRLALGRLRIVTKSELSRALSFSPQECTAMRHSPCRPILNQAAGSRFC